VTKVVVAKLVCERVLLAVETWIEEGPLSAHLGIRHVGVPVSDIPPCAGVGVIVHAGQPESGWKERRAGLAVWPKRFAVLVNQGVVPTGAPAQKNLLQVVQAEPQLV